MNKLKYLISFSLILLTVIIQSTIVFAYPIDTEDTNNSYYSLRGRLSIGIFGSYPDMSYEASGWTLTTQNETSFDVDTIRVVYSVYYNGIKQPTVTDEQYDEAFAYNTYYDQDNNTYDYTAYGSHTAYDDLGNLWVGTYCSWP